MFLFAFIFLIMSSICFPKSKLLMAFWGLFLIVNVVCTMESSDVIALEYRYTYRGFAEFPPLFREMMKLFAEHNFTFAQFKFLYICVVAIITIVTVSIGTKYIAFCMMLICVYPGWCFSGQIRNTIGAIIVVLAMVYLVKSNSKRKHLIYIIAVIIATLIHPSCIAYLLVLLCLKAQIHVSKKVVLGYLIVTVALYSNALYRITSIFIRNDRILQYIRVSLSSNLFGSFVVIVGQIVLTYFIVKQLKYARSKCNGNEILTSDKYNLMIRINQAFLIIVPFYGINHAVFRIFKYLLIVDYCFIAENAFNKQYIRIKNFVIILAIAFLSLIAQITVDGSIRDILLFLKISIWNNLEQFFID